jgi:hypothetical protein
MFINISTETSVYFCSTTRPHFSGNSNSFSDNFVVLVTVVLCTPFFGEASSHPVTSEARCLQQIWNEIVQIWARRLLRVFQQSQEKWQHIMYCIGRNPPYSYVSVFIKWYVCICVSCVYVSPVWRSIFCNWICSKTCKENYAYWIIPHVQWSAVFSLYQRSKHF